MQKVVSIVGDQTEVQVAECNEKLETTSIIEPTAKGSYSFALKPGMIVLIKVPEAVVDSESSSVD